MNQEKFVLSTHAKDQLRDRFNLTPGEIRQLQGKPFEYVGPQLHGERMYRVTHMGYEIFMPCAPSYSRGTCTWVVKTVLERDHAMSNLSFSRHRSILVQEMATGGIAHPKIVFDPAAPVPSPEILQSFTTQGSYNAWASRERQRIEKETRKAARAAAHAERMATIKADKEARRLKNEAFQAEAQMRKYGKTLGYDGLEIRGVDPVQGHPEG